MPTSVHRESAKIYQFPTRIRPIVDRHRDEVTTSADAASPRVATAVFGSGWYHEAAIDAERSVKR
jgi:hypothetical protein